MARKMLLLCLKCCLQTQFKGGGWLARYYSHIYKHLSVVLKLECFVTSYSYKLPTTYDALLCKPERALGEGKVIEIRRMASSWMLRSVALVRTDV
jgi:hypothetical protein